MWQPKTDLQDKKMPLLLSVFTFCLDSSSVSQETFLAYLGDSRPQILRR